MELCDTIKPGKEYTATIKGKGRSLDANAYAWVLLDKLAAHYGVARENVYRQEIQSIGGVSEVLCLREKAVEADLSGFVVPDEFVVGYGLDYCQQYRNMPYIGVLKPEVYTK